MNHTEDWVIQAENLSYSYEENDRKALDGLSVRMVPESPHFFCA